MAGVREGGRGGVLFTLKLRAEKNSLFIYFSRGSFLSRATPPENRS